MAAPHGSDSPIDPVSARRLADRGLRLGLVDTDDTAAFEAWLQTEIRGFHGPRRGEKEIAGLMRDAAHRRTTGVWDAGETEHPEEPVGTVSSWVAPLSLPGGADIDAWAISSVTVAPTHRRRGIARALLESELRTAQADGVPVAMLTVSEATIYGRYGFAPAARAVDLEIDARKAGWRGPEPAGRIRFTTLEELRAGARDLFEAARRRAPGQTSVDDALWAELLRLTEAESDTSARPRIRAIRYDDDTGTARGFAVYRVDGGDSDFSDHVADVQVLCAATDDAEAALWRFLLDLDLVGHVKASLRSTDEAVRWMVADDRAVRVARDYDHLWVRLIDVPAALEARRYAGAGAVLFEIDDPLGLAADRVLLETDAAGAGRATVLAAADAAPAGASVIAAGVAELGALWLGGAGARTLARAGRLEERTADAADAVDALLHSPVAPWLNIWF